MTGPGRPPEGTFGDVLAARRRRGFIGRMSEIDLFRAALDVADPLFSVLHVSGPGGIGKSSLLDALAEVASDAGGSTRPSTGGRRWTRPASVSATPAASTASRPAR